VSEPAPVRPDEPYDVSLSRPEDPYVSEVPPVRPELPYVSESPVRPDEPYVSEPPVRPELPPKALSVRSLFSSRPSRPEEP